MKTVENIPFKTSKWDEEAVPDHLQNMKIEVHENDQGRLSLNLLINGENQVIITNVCPDHYREQIDFLWLGIEQGYDLATNDL